MRRSGPIAEPLGASNWKRTYWVVWIANLVTSIGMMSFLPFFPSLLAEMGVTDEGARSTWAGVCFAAAPLSATISAPMWGALGDRFGRKVMVCRAMLAISIFVGGMGFVQTPWQLLAMRLGQGVFSGFIPPSITLVSIVAPADRQGRVAGNLGMALGIGGLVGPMLGGFLATSLGSRREVFFVVGALAFVSTLIVWFGAEEDAGLRRKSDEPVGERRGPLQRVSSAFRNMGRDIAEVLSSPAMRATAFVVFSLQFGLGAINPVMEMYVETLVDGSFAGGAWEWLANRVGSDSLTLEERIETLATSIAFGAMAIANLISLPLWGRYGDAVGHSRALAQCGVLGIVALIVQAATPLLSVLLIGRFVMGVAMAGIGPLAFGLAAGAASADRRGGAFGVVFSARTFAVAVGGVFGGVAYTVVGARGLMFGAALLVLGTLWVFRRAADRAVARPMA